MSRTNNAVFKIFYFFRRLKYKSFKTADFIARFCHYLFFELTDSLNPP